MEDNHGIFLFKKEEGNIVHFYTLALWNGWEDIKKFAGTDFEKAQYYPEDKDFLLELEPNITHWTVLEIRNTT